MFAVNTFPPMTSFAIMDIDNLPARKKKRNMMSRNLSQRQDDKEITLTLTPIDRLSQLPPGPLRQTTAPPQEGRAWAFTRPRLGNPGTITVYFVEVKDERNRNDA